MRLIFLHGIGQQGRVAEALKSEWKGWLQAAMPDPQVLASADIAMPYYGNILDALTQGKGHALAIEQGAGGIDTEELAFLAEAMDEAALAAGISARDVAIEQRAESAVAVEQGGLMSPRINALARLIERFSPVHGRWVLPLVRQAYAYLRKPGVAPAIDALVLPVLEAGPAVVLSHSLGTVVAFKLMRALAQAGRPVACPLLLSLGSPIALRAVSKALGVPFQIPPGVGHWLNAVEPGDSVTLGKPLDATTFCDGIENIMDIKNMASDSPHDVQGYLADRRIAARVEMALR